MDYKDKIRKLLALAKSPEPEEAKLALLKARKLMAEHKLTERDLDEHDTTVIQQEIDETFSKKANSWMAPLSSIIGENYCCAAYRCKRGAKTTVWRVGFIGLKDDFEICVKIFRYAVRCVKSEQKKLRKQHRDYYTPQEIAKICDSYGYGFARGVYEAFTRQNEENQEYGLVTKLGIGADKVGRDVPEESEVRVAGEVERYAGLKATRPAVRVRTGRAVGKMGHRGCSHPDGGLVLTGTAEERANLDALTLHGTGLPDTIGEHGHGRVIPGSFQTLKNGHISYASISMSSSSMLPYTQCSEISRALLRAEGSETASILRSVT